MPRSLVLVTLAAGLASCGAEPGAECRATIDVRVPDTAIFGGAGVATLQLHLYSYGQRIFSVALDAFGAAEAATIPVTTTAGGSDRPAIPPGEVFTLVLEGVDLLGAVVAFGRTAPFACLAGESPRPLLYFAPPNRFTTVDTLDEARIGATATAVGAEHVLVVGGANELGDAPTDSVLYYDHRVGRMSRISGELPAGRVGHSATRLDDGRVLIFGGRAPQPGDVTQAPLRADAYIFDPSTTAFVPLRLAGSFAPRHGHAAVLLTGDNVPPDLRGRVLVTGGRDGAGWRCDALLLDPATGVSETLVDSMDSARSQHTADLLSSGHVLIVGGYDADGLAEGAELFDSEQRTFAAATDAEGAVTPPRARRTRHASARLADGSILFWGGQLLAGADDPPPAVELFALGTGRFVALPVSPPIAPDQTLSALALVGAPCPACPLLALGGPQATIYFPGNPGDVAALPDSAGAVPRTGHAAAALADGTVVVLGGADPASGAVITQVGVYNRCESDLACPGP